MRTQNSTLILYMMQFFKLWRGIERRYIGETEYIIEDGKLSRKLKARINSSASEYMSSATLGELIAEYIGTLDKAMKVYFSKINDIDEASLEISRIYREYLQRSAEII